MENSKIAISPVIPVLIGWQTGDLQIERPSATRSAFVPLLILYVSNTLLLEARLLCEPDV